MGERSATHHRAVNGYASPQIPQMKGKQFFFEKKNQKTFACFAELVSATRAWVG
jgi:hypothetical protein